MDGRQLAKRLLMTPGPFMRWLLLQKSKAACGTTRHARCDAIANFLAAWGIEARVLQGGLEIDGKTMLAPVWVRVFTFLCDTRGWQYVTPERCMDMLYDTLEHPSVREYYGE